MQTSATAWLGHQPLGEFEPGVDIRTGAPPEGIAFFCAYCGEVWARIVSGGRTWPRTVPCRRHHRSPFLPGGSFWLELEPHFTSHYPRGVLLHEFLLLCDLIQQHPEAYQLPEVGE